MTGVGDPDADFEAFALSRSTPLLRTAVLLCRATSARERTCWRRSWHGWPGGGRPPATTRRATSGRRWSTRPSTGGVGRSRRRVQEYALDLSLERASGDRDPGDLLGERDEVAAAVASLPNGQRAVVVLRYFEDLSDVDTAALLGVSPGSVRSQTHTGPWPGCAPARATDERPGRGREHRR